MVHRQQHRFHARDPVDVEHEAPYFAGGLERGTERLNHLDVPDRRATFELLIHAIERVAGGPAIEGQQDAIQLTAALSPVLGIGEPSVPPPVGTARDHSRLGEPHALVSLGERG